MLHKVFEGFYFLTATSSDLELADVNSHVTMPLSPQRCILYFPLHAFVNASIVKGWHHEEDLYSACLNYHPDVYLHYCGEI
ncbi:hypothetical protein, partial [Streptomyces brasiliscabiei]|uniref:hypothetical protein n=1 Tax=Streptomyces brasiliscabiei TaxID=2736302 RepID=UPI003014F4C9